jgi:DNA-binding LytR/AlgR family response regulator
MEQQVSTPAPQQAIGDLGSELDPDRFVRIHRSYLLNIERLDKLELYAKDSRVAIRAMGRGCRSVVAGMRG